MKFFLLSFLILGMAGPAVAVEPGEMLDDPALETRAREISKDLRCVQCQNESIDASDAQIARDMRILVRERLIQGDTDEEIIDYMISRYGDYVLFDPRLQPNTVLLWFGPALVFLIGLWIIVRRLRSAASAEPTPPLTPEERAALETSAVDDARDSGGSAP
ncbi:MAG: cytochrome c-type biogenesis protein [Rhodospirillaceae bacterium]